MRITKIFVALVFAVLAINVVAQTNMPAYSKYVIDDIAKQIKYEKLDGRTIELISRKYPVNYLGGTHCVSFVGLVDDNFNEAELTGKNISIGSKTGNIVTFRVPLESLSDVKDLKGFNYIEVAGMVKPHLDKAVKDVRADSVHMGINLPQPYTGKNVLIGVTDWGFDYSHPMFYDTALTQTRILAAWDQFKTSGPAPTGFDYGTEFSTIQELSDAKADTFNIYQYATHGSHVAGIAGGGGAGTTFRGVAFDAQFLFATFLIDAAAVLDAYSWMKSKADQEQKRLVINMSWGLYYMGTLDGTSLLSQAISQLSQEGVVFVTSNGNNGDENFHIKKTFTNDTLKTRIGFDNYSYYATMWGQSITMWGQPGNAFSAGILVYNSQNQLLSQTPMFYTDSLNQYVDSFLVVASDTIFFNVMADSAHYLNQRPHMRLRVKNTNTSYKIGLKAHAGSGTVHFWNIIELTNDVGNWGLPFQTLLSGWTAGDNLYGIGEPACAEDVISVGAYASEYTAGNGNLYGGTLSGFSSIGPTLDGRIKPEITAPGSNVASSISSYTTNSYTAIKTITFNGRDYKFARFSGTSMSSPMVTGVVALMLEADPDITHQEVKDIIIETAREDAKTGVIPDTGSTKWGWGKIHAYHAVAKVLGIDGINSFLIEDEVALFPNPSNSSISIYNLKSNEDFVVKFYTVDGKLIKEIKCLNSEKITVNDLSSGLYFVEIKNTSRAFMTKFIKN